MAALALISTRPALAGTQPAATAAPASPTDHPSPLGPLGSPEKIISAGETVALFALISLAPAALLMVTAFVRISIVLTLLRQALGSPQVPGNQVITALALLLTAIVMKPVAEEVYVKGIEPYRLHRASAEEAWTASTQPIKKFMINQIYLTNHQHYLRVLYDHAEPPSPGRIEPTQVEELPLRIVAPAFLLSELTTALMIGFAIYLPFLVIDLVVSAVLSAMGLYMLPPSLVAMPMKLIVFVLADGWILVPEMLLRSFGY
ncbi:MAG TPA: flagellar type III secretion system pore protein FliP [Isosphaeraceae bacterium]|nr:flagellar type III secretion system pore protein FliP [Isosphaeraceae bacterium]